jgi:hypothetical protein
MEQGWIKLFRSLTDNPIWRSEPFTRGQAWVDLLLLANFDRSYFFKRGVKIVVERGQVARSEVELADRWKWSRTKVRKFINDLEKEQQIEQQKTNVTQLLTIVNYNFYQEKEQQTGQQKDSRKTPERQQKNTLKEEQENKEGKEFKEDIKSISVENENYIEAEVISILSFEEFWTMYDKKVGDKTKISKKWEAISEQDRQKVREHIPQYKLAQPDKQYRKNPETYLNNKSWNDEIIAKGKTAFGTPGNKEATSWDELAVTIQNAFGK